MIIQIASKLYLEKGFAETSLDMRVACGLDAALSLYNVPEALRNQKIEKIVAMDYYRSFGRRILSDFKDYITAVNWQAVETIRQKMIEKSQKSKSKKEVIT